MLSVGLPLGGKIVTVHLHSGGIAAVYDPSVGAWELRQLPPERANEAIGNMAQAIPAGIQLPLSLVGGDHAGSGLEVTAGFKDWVRR